LAEVRAVQGGGGGGHHWGCPARFYNAGRARGWGWIRVWVL